MTFPFCNFPEGMPSARTLSRGSNVCKRKVSIGLPRREISQSNEAYLLNKHFTINRSVREILFYRTYRGVALPHITIKRESLYTEDVKTAIKINTLQE